MDKVDQIVQEFIKQTDDDLQLQKELNEFAAQLTPALLKNINTNEAVTGAYGDKYLAFRLNGQTVNNSVIYTIRLMDLEEYKKYFRMGVPEYAKSIRADFEHDNSYRLEDEIKNVVTMLLFRKFDIEISPDSEDDGLVNV